MYNSLKNNFELPKDEMQHLCWQNFTLYKNIFSGAGIFTRN